MTRRRRPSPSHPRRAIAPHFTREGRPKTSYRTQAEAAGAAQLAWTLHRAELDTYRCDYCHQWHIGKRFRDE
ncbi:MAG TPA: hypothetical protein VLS91_07275 [Acidimicrobiales bacterium]|nr:hypothetical protein [Acidimicrobiales bacterium]